VGCNRESSVARCADRHRGGFRQRRHRTFLRAWLQTSRFVLGGRHGCTPVGNNDGFLHEIVNGPFTCWHPRAEEPVSFLNLLRAGHNLYVLHDAAYDYHQRAASAPADRPPDGQTRPASPDHAAGWPPSTVSASPGAGRHPTRCGRHRGRHVGRVHRTILCDACAEGDDADSSRRPAIALCWVHSDDCAISSWNLHRQHTAAQVPVLSLTVLLCQSQGYQLKHARPGGALRARFDHIFPAAQPLRTLERLRHGCNANRPELLGLSDRRSHSPTVRKTTSAAYVTVASSAEPPCCVKSLANCYPPLSRSILTPHGHGLLLHVIHEGTASLAHSPQALRVAKSRDSLCITW